MMDDLSGLDWSSTSLTKGQPKKTAPTNAPQASYYPAFRPTPPPQVSGRNTPLSGQGSGPSATKATYTKPPIDSFSNLVQFGSAKNNANISLRERQEQLEADRRRKEEERLKEMQSQYGGGQFWDSLGQGTTGASRTTSASAVSTKGGTDIIGVTGAAARCEDAEDDLFAAFNKDTKVDNSSHYPPPLQPSSGKSTPFSAARLDLGNASAWNQPPSLSGQEIGNGIEDDDPFGLKEMKPRVRLQAQALEDDEDVLGDLAKPVEEVRRKVRASHTAREPGKPIEESDSGSEVGIAPPHERGDPFDKAVAELVDMGFTPENARRGLTESGAGLSTQAAVGWLLDDAHKTSRKQQTPGNQFLEDGRQSNDAGRSRNKHTSPAWVTDEQSERPARRDNRSPVAGTNDLQQKAAAVGSNIFKTANSLWKTGQKQVQKAVAEFAQEGSDRGQPKWMRSAQGDRTGPPCKQEVDVTDEALMLESGTRPERGPPRASRETRPGSTRAGSFTDPSHALASRHGQASPVPRWQQGTRPPDGRQRLSKQVLEEQSAQAYISPARRRKATPQPEAQADHIAEPEPDLLIKPAGLRASQTRRQHSVASAGTTKPFDQADSRPATSRPPRPRRQIPPISSSALQASRQNRLDGTAHFKRGDYDAAHTAYTKSLAGIPQAHPLNIVLLTNRSLTALKTGSPKQAVDDADAAIQIIGPSRGEGEHVSVGDGEQRDMKELYGKALSRKAEALEQMEKWADAGNVWQLCVEAGLGGATAIAGRQRCLKALAPKPQAAAAARPAQPRPRPKPSAVSDLAPRQDSEAVQRLRQANRAAEEAEDERFALSDKVDARIGAWRDGKRDNLRALLGSLDQVLWEGSGWNKVGLHELVMANKVKIHYMKAIAKCHPDKNAGIEVQLIAATVFATLNESWDKFKAENGL